MANTKQLKTSVVLDTRSAKSSLKQLEQRIKSVQATIEKQNKTINKINTTYNKVNTTANKATASINRNTKAMTQNGRSATLLTTKLKRLAGAYLGVMGAQAAIRTSDTITSAENRLNALNGNDKAATQLSMDKMYVASQNARMRYGDMLANASKSMTLAGDAFQGNIDNAIRFQEIMAKSYTLGGASAAEQSSSMYQMIQALGSGTLQGDELRSVREGAPMAYKEIEKFAQGVYNSTESLKEMASEGKITSDMVVAAMMNAGESIDKAFENTDMTFGQAFNKIQGIAIKSFEPVLQMLNDALNSEAGQAIINGIGWALQFIAGVLRIVFELIGSVYNYIVDNWSWISKILTILGVLIGVNLISKLWGVMVSLAETIILWVWYKLEAIEAAIASASALSIVLIAIAAVIIAVFFMADSFSDACGIIVGVISAALSVVWNLFVTLIAYIIQHVILPLVTAWEIFANFFGNLFNDPIAAIIRAFETLGKSVLSILSTIAKCIDAIFGSNLAEAVSGWSEKLGGKADELVEKYGNGTYEQKSDAVAKLTETLNSGQDKLLWSTSDAYSYGYDLGYGWGEAIRGMGSWINDKLGLDNLSKFDDQSKYGVGGAYSMPDNLAKTADNTGDIADSMKLAEEDLAYLRDLAEMEWKKEFTTANITVDMSNYNTINGDGDLDGIATRLADKLYEELHSVANGVYA